MPARPKRESQSRYVLLGLLNDHPGTGYELRQRLETSVGFFWNESWGQIYPTLKQLEKARLIHGAMRASQGKPDARVYSITRTGKEELRNWLQLPPQEEKPRHQTLLKLFFTSRDFTDANREMLLKRLATFQNRLGVFTRLEQVIVADNPGHPQLIFWRMTVRYGQKRAESEIAWCRECLQVLDEAMKAEPDHLLEKTQEVKHK